MSSYETLRPNQQRLLRCFEACGNITKSARWAKLSRQMHYAWYEESAEYRAAFEIARTRAVSVLEDECIRRAHDGVRRPVFYKGRIVGHVLEYSDQLLITALKAWDPERYKDRTANEITGKDGKPVLDLDAVRAFIRQSPEDGE